MSSISLSPVGEIMMMNSEIVFFFSMPTQELNIQGSVRSEPVIKSLTVGMVPLQRSKSKIEMCALKRIVSEN